MKNELEIIVQKYGGSSVATPEKIKGVAEFIKTTLKSDLRVCVVVSAMGHTTNELIAMAHQISTNPPKRELDMLISCGERSSMALLAMALHSVGVKAISLTGSQSGIITDDNHMGAEIVAVKPSRVLSEFLNNQVVIIAGFQGISSKKEITTLRRGGSDTTAVAMASALNAKVCEIYTDVLGVMDADPKIVDDAEIIPHLRFERMEAMALYGAKIMAHDALRLARQFNIELRVKKACHAENGTLINGNIHENNRKLKPFALTHLRAVIKFCLEKNALPKVVNNNGYFLCGCMRDGVFIGYASNDIAQEIDSFPHFLEKPGLALITIHLNKNQLALRALKQVNDILDGQDIPIEDVILGHNEIFVIVADNRLPDTLAHLHAGLEIGVN